MYFIRGLSLNIAFLFLGLWRGFLSFVRGSRQRFSLVDYWLTFQNERETRDSREEIKKLLTIVMVEFPV